MPRASAGVSRLARLRDDDGEGLVVGDRLPVAVFRPVVDFDRHTRELPDHELAEGPLPRRAARQDDDLLDLRELRAGEVHFLEAHVARVGRHVAADGLPHGRRLLEDFLEHEMRIAGLLGRDRIPQHALHDGRRRRADKISERDAVAGDDRHLFVAEVHDVTRVTQDGRRIGGDEEVPAESSPPTPTTIGGPLHCDDLVRSSAEMMTRANRPRISVSARRTPAEAGTLG